MKIATVIGARPQFIKAAVVSRAIQNINSAKHCASIINEIIIHTGQHYDENMSDIFFNELVIPQPDYNLGIGSDNHGAQTGKMLEEIEKVLIFEKPDLALVYGDTNSTLAGALAAVKLHIPIAHVESGLRSNNRKMPEEINRILTDHIAEILFTPTKTSVSNLIKEGIPTSKIYLVGDVMFDASLFYADKAAKNSKILFKFNLESKKYILATVHRAENTDNSSRLKAIFYGLMKISEDIPVVLPLHPRTQVALIREGLFERVNNSILIIPPVGYIDMIMLEMNARLIVTDSGGVQKEAYFYHIPCATLRDQTEWVELVEMGWNCLINCNNMDQVATGVLDRLSTKGDNRIQLYGDGCAAIKILNQVFDYFKN